MSNLPNTIRMYAEDMHSAIGHSDCSSAMSLAADLLEEQKGTIAALNIALGGADSTSTENLIDAHEFDIADVGLIAVCRKLIAEISELKASPLSEEALDILRSKNKQLEQERDQLKEDYQRTCHLVAQMHMAAMNGVIGPKRGVIEDIAYLREERDNIAAQNEAMRTVVESLWGIIDDIDTYGDMAKADDKLFRSLVERRQKDRWETGVTTDGYSLDLHLPNLAAEFLKRRDAETLRRAANVCYLRSKLVAAECGRAIEKLAAEIEKETT